MFPLEFFVVYRGHKMYIYTHTHIYIYIYIYIYRSTYSIFLCDTHSTTMKKSAPKGPARYNHPRVLTLLSLMRTTRIFLSQALRNSLRNTTSIQHPLRIIFILLLLRLSIPLLSGRLSMPWRLRTNQTACVQKLHTQSYL
jgi:hypothetical protein